MSFSCIIINFTWRSKWSSRNKVNEGIYCRRRLANQKFFLMELFTNVKRAINVRILKQIENIDNPVVTEMT